MTKLMSGVALSAVMGAMAWCVPAYAQDTPTNEELLKRIEKLEAQNAALMQRLNVVLSDAELKRLPKKVDDATDTIPNKTGFVGTDAKYGYDVLDPVENINKKRMVVLEARKEDRLKNPLTISGQVTAIANAQRSNRDSKFGYLMRHPTSANQLGKDVSEALIHSANVAFTANLNDWITGYLELLYSPEQSFGSGTLTDLNRNQVDARRAFILFGDLKKSPLFAAIGKMDTPFGLNDSVSPFTNSTNWHAFAGHAYGAELGYVKDGLMLRAMAIQGGAQFRAHNMPVVGTNVPSRLNNFAVDGNYTFAFNEADDLMLGASYTHGSAYCQDYPVFHFNPCSEANPAWSAYGVLNMGPVEILGEYAQTTKEWPGSAVPDPTNPLSIYEAQKTSAFTIGGRYGFGPVLLTGDSSSYVSLEFSNFTAGDDGAPWERQNQIVLGYSRFLTDNVNFFGEFIHVDGFAPLNFISGGNFPDGSSWSDNDATTDVLLIGATAAF